MHETIAASFDRSFGLFGDLAGSLAAGALNSKLNGLPSNTLGQQLWCVVGARESYAQAIRVGGWSGFSCSLSDPGDPRQVAAALGRSAEGVRAVTGRMEAFTEVQERLLIDLLEHEAAHQGQIIRYLYGLRLSIPRSWKERYALE